MIDSYKFQSAFSSCRLTFMCWSIVIGLTSKSGKIGNYYKLTEKLLQIGLVADSVHPWWMQSVWTVWIKIPHHFLLLILVLGLILSHPYKSKSLCNAEKVERGATLSCTNNIIIIEPLGNWASANDSVICQQKWKVIIIEQWSLFNNNNNEALSH